MEEIEGSAAYVEWMVLQQLDAARAKDFTARMCSSVTDPKALLPIRISCYDTGALLFHAMAAAGDDPFTPAELLGLNIYDARRVGNALTSRYFLMVRQAGAEKTLYGDFVIQMLDERTVGRVYRM